MSAVMQMPRVMEDYAPLQGGIDTLSSVYGMKPGRMLDCLNYEPASYGGYALLDGYERFDGRKSPADSDYVRVPVTFSGTIAVGDTVLISGSTTTKALEVGSDYVVLGDYDSDTGIVPNSVSISATLSVGGSTKATVTATVAKNNGSTSLEHANFKYLAAENNRAKIGSVPGSGSILGIFMFQGDVFAFRNNAGGTEKCLYTSRSALSYPTGWTKVSLGYEVVFSAGGTATPADGATLTQGGVTATVRRVLTRTGTWSGTAAGTFVITAPAGGNFAAGAATLTGGATCTLAGIQTAITLSPGGICESVEGVMTGSSTDFRVYGCDGVNPAFEFSISGPNLIYAPIHTGMTTDTPNHIAIHKHHLFLSFGSSLQHSGIGDQYSWTAVTGASELATGDYINALSEQYGEVLAIHCVSKTYQLLGSSTADWKMDVLIPDVGAVARTVQGMGFSYSLSQQGISRLAPSINYGNFQSSTISETIQPIIDGIKSTVVASSVYRSRNQYRLYTSDGKGVIMGMVENKVIGFTKFEYPIGISCVWSVSSLIWGATALSSERIFIGGTDGYVYEANKGTTFDGTRRDAYVMLAHNSNKMPRYRKRYRKVVLEMKSAGYSELGFYPEFSFGDNDPATHISQSVIGTGGHWDMSDWTTFQYDSASVQAPEFSVSGTGTAMSLVFYSQSYIDAGHTLEGVFVTYTPRRLSR